MTEYRTMDLGQIMQTAEAIKGMKRQAESDRLRDAYLGVRMKNEEQAGVQEQQKHESAVNMDRAKFRYLLAQTALNDPDPVNSIRQYAPDMIRDFNAHHGEGAFERLQPEQLRQVLSQVGQYAAAQAGIQPQKPLKIEQIAGPNGSTILTRGDDWKVIEAQKPEKAQAAFRPMSQQEVTAAGLPPGTAAQVNDSTGQISVLSKRDATANLSQKDATVAKMKLNTLNLARQQLSNIQQRFNDIKDSFVAGGGGQGKLPTPKGQAFDRAVDQMRSTLTALTRVPGVGAMSDFETKLDQAKFPSRSDYENVTQQQIDDISMMLRTLEDGYNGLLTGNVTQDPPEPDLSAMSNEDLLKALNGG